MHLLPRHDHSTLHKTLQQVVAGAFNGLLQYPTPTSALLVARWFDLVECSASEAQGGNNLRFEPIWLVLEGAIKGNFLLPKSEREKLDLLPHHIRNFGAGPRSLLVACHNWAQGDEESVIVKNVHDRARRDVGWHGGGDGVVPSRPQGHDAASARRADPFDSLSVIPDLAIFSPSESSTLDGVEYSDYLFACAGIITIGRSLNAMESESGRRSVSLRRRTGRGEAE